VVVDQKELGIDSIDPQHTSELIRLGIAVRTAANEQIKVRHPTMKHIQTIDICMITAPPSGPHADARNIVILGEAQADRSPCGTGTCARMALLHRKGKLARGQVFRHESSIRSVLKGEILAETQVGDFPAIIPRISCRPFLTGFHSFVIDADDPFAEGFALA
jgi:proline racemase